MSDLKNRRKGLGLARAQLAEAARVDVRTLQLLELDQSEDTESASRVERTLDALEAGEPAPDFSEEIRQILRETQPITPENGG